MLIKIAQWPALWWKSELVLSHICLGGSYKDGPWCAGLEMTSCLPSVVPYTAVSPTGDKVNRRRHEDYVFKDARVSHDIVCDIWGTTELRANNILIGFFGLNVFSGGCSWWCHLTHQLSCCCSIIEVKSANGKHCVRHAEDGGKERCVKRQSWQTDGVMNEKTERWKLTVTVEDSGFSTCTCTRIVKHIPRSWQPMCEVKTAESHEILSSTMIYSPCQIQWKPN